jgi:hypothetical protein
VYLLRPDEIEAAYNKAMDIPRLTVPNFPDVIWRKDVV